MKVFYSLGTCLLFSSFVAKAGDLPVCIYQIHSDKKQTFWASAETLEKEPGKATVQFHSHESATDTVKDGTLKVPVWLERTSDREVLQAVKVPLEQPDWSSEVLLEAQKKMNLPLQSATSGTLFSVEMPSPPPLFPSLLHNIFEIHSAGVFELLDENESRLSQFILFFRSAAVSLEKAEDVHWAMTERAGNCLTTALPKPFPEPKLERPEVQCRVTTTFRFPESGPETYLYEISGVYEASMARKDITGVMIRDLKSKETVVTTHSNGSSTRSRLGLSYLGRKDTNVTDRITRGEILADEKLKGIFRTSNIPLDQVNSALLIRHAVQGVVEVQTLSALASDGRKLGDAYLVRSISGQSETSGRCR